MARGTYKCAKETKKRLLETVIELIKEKGYANVSVRDICRIAEVSSGSFYHHYPSKEALVLDAYYHIDQYVTKEFIEKCEKQPPRDSIRSLLGLYLKLIDEEIGLLVKEYYRVMLEGMNISALDPHRPYYQALCAQAERGITDGSFRRECEAKEIAEYFMRFLRSEIFDWAIHGGNYNLVAQFLKDYELALWGIVASKER